MRQLPSSPRHAADNQHRSRQRINCAPNPLPVLLPTMKPLSSFARSSALAALLIAVTCANALGQEVKIGGTGAALGTMKILADAYSRQQPDFRFVVLPSLGTSGGIKALRAGAIQVGVSARPLLDSEAQGGFMSTEYGRTPFIFATSLVSPAVGITTQALADLYAGKVDKWPDGTLVRMVMRPVGDSDTEIIKSMSSDMRAAKDAAEKRPGMLFTVTDQETADTIEKVPGSLGPSTLALMRSERRAIRALSLDGVAPEVKTLADGRYPLSKTMYLVTPSAPRTEVQGFIDFVRSPAGRALLVQNGHWVK
jgi:phosphate transport system substrate-binding protein